MVNRFVVGGVVWGALAAGLAGCAPAGAGDPVSASPGVPSVSQSPVTSPSPLVTASPTVQPVALEVLCDADLVVHVSSETVTATSAGVPLLVSSEAPAGAYLNYTYGGDALPASPQVWTLTAAPGPLTLFCSTLEVEGVPVEVTVADPNTYWSAATLEDYGCSSGVAVDWVIPPATGETPDEAIKNLIANFGESSTHRPLTRWEHAALGYPGAATQTWVIGSPDNPKITALVTDFGEGFQASADGLCDEGVWAMPGA